MRFEIFRPPPLPKKKEKKKRMRPGRQSLCEASQNLHEASQDVYVWLCMTSAGGPRQKMMLCRGVKALKKAYLFIELCNAVLHFPSEHNLYIKLRFYKKTNVKNKQLYVTETRRDKSVLENTDTPVCL